MSSKLSDINKSFNDNIKTSFNLYKFLDSKLEEYYTNKTSSPDSYLEKYDIRSSNPDKQHYTDKYYWGIEVRSDNNRNYLDVTQCLNGSIFLMKYKKMDTKDSKDYKDRYKRVLQDAIDFVSYFYNSLSDYLLSTFNLDSDKYYIKYNKVYNDDIGYRESKYSYYKKSSNKLLDRYNYEPCISISYYETSIKQREYSLTLINGSKILKSTNVINKINRDNYDNKMSEYYHRSIIFPFDNKIAFNDILNPKDSLEDNMIKAYDDCEEYVEVINDLYTNSDSKTIRDDILDVLMSSSLKGIATNDNLIAPRHILFYNLVSFLSIGIYSKEDNKLRLLIDSNVTTGNLKVVNECTGFNEVISYKRLKNLTSNNKATYIESIDVNELKKKRFLTNRESIDNVNEIVYKINNEIKSMFYNTIRNIFERENHLRTYIYFNIDNKNTMNRNNYKDLIQIDMTLFYSLYSILVRYYPDYTFSKKCVRSSTNIFNYIHKDKEDSMFIEYRFFEYLFSCKDFDKQEEKNKEAIERLKEIDRTKIIGSYIEIGEKDNVLYENNEIGKFVKFMTNTYNEIYRYIVDTLDKEIDFDLIDKNRKIVNEYTYKINKIMDKYKLGANLKRDMRKIKDIDDFKEIITEANYFVGNGLSLKYKEICF